MKTSKPEKAAYQGPDISKQVREGLGMRLTELSGLTGVDIALLSRVERGLRSSRPRRWRSPACPIEPPGAPSPRARNNSMHCDGVGFAPCRA